MQWQMGEVTTVLSSTNEVQIRDSYNKAVLTIALNNIPQIQYMPTVGDIVLYINWDDKIQQIAKIWNIKQNNFLRQGDSPLQEGELQLMGVLGQYIHLDKKGTIKFVDSTMINIFELSVNGLIAKLKKFQIDTYDGVNITIDKDISISRQKPKDKKPTFSFTANDDGIILKNNKVEIIIDNNNRIHFKGDNFQLGEELTAKCVTSMSGVTGSHSVCFVTGTPIPGCKRTTAE